MSSARKRAAIQKANREADHLRQRLILAENHIETLRTMAEAIGLAGNEMSKALSVIADGDGDAQVIAAQTLEKVGVRRTASEGHNALEDARALARGVLHNVEFRRGEAIACNAGLGAVRPGEDCK